VNNALPGHTPTCARAMYVQASAGCTAAAWHTLVLAAGCCTPVSPVHALCEHKLAEQLQGMPTALQDDRRILARRQVRKGPARCILAARTRQQQLKRLRRCRTGLQGERLARQPGPQLQSRGACSVLHVSARSCQQQRHTCLHHHHTRKHACTWTTGRGQVPTKPQHARVRAF